MGICKRYSITKQTGSKYKVGIEFYESAADVVRDIKTRPVLIKDYSMDGRSYKQSWDGVDSYDEAFDLFSHGYQPAVDKLRKSLSGSMCGESTRVKFFNNVQGFTPVVPLALMNVPNSMVDMRITKLSAKVIDVYYDMAINCGYSSEDIIKCGIKVLGSIIELERKGYKFNLYAVQSFSGSESTHTLCVKVKSSNQPLDLKRISFPMMHTAFFRVIGFDWQGKSPASDFIGCGRGRSMMSNLCEKDIEQYVRTAFGNNATYISCDRIIRKDKGDIKEILVNEKKK